MSRGDNPYTSPRSVGESSTTGVRWRILMLVMALVFAGQFSRYAMQSAGTIGIIPQYNIDPDQMGWVYSAFLFTYTLMMIPCGVLIDRVGTRRALGWMALGLALFTLLTGVAGWISSSAVVVFWGLIVVRGLMGVIAAPLHPAAARHLGAWFPLSQRTFANGMVTATALVAIASSYVVFGWLVDYFKWPGAFVAIFLPILIVAVLWLWYSTDAPRQHSAVSSSELVAIRDDFGAVPNSSLTETVSTSANRMATGDWLSLLTNRNVLLPTLSYAAVGYFQYMFFYWIQYYFKDTVKVSDSESRWYSTVITLAMAVGMFAGGWLVDKLRPSLGVRWSRSGIAIVGMAASGGLLFLGLWVTDPRWIAFWFAVSLGSLGLSEGGFWVTVVEAGGKKGGVAAGIMNFGGNAGGMLAPVITPWLSVKTGSWIAGMSVGAIACLVGAVLWLWVDPLLQKPLTLREAEEEAAEAVPEPL